MQKIAKNSPSGQCCTTLSVCIFATKARIDNRKKNLLDSNISPTCSYNMANFSRLAAEIGSVLLGAPKQISFFFSSPNLSGPRLDVCHTLCGLSANLRCRSETWCTWLTEKYRTQKLVKKSPSWHHHTTLSGYISATKAHIDNRKEILKQQYLLHTFPQYSELRPISG